MGNKKSWRDEQWESMYFHPELHKAAKHLSPDLWEDLLSDAITKVFEKSDDDLRLIRSMKDYVFMTMRNTRNSRAWRESYNTPAADEFVDMAEPEDDAEITDVTAEEAEYSSRIFGTVNKESVLLMRKIEEADASKLTNPRLWNAAQYVKLYIDPEYGGSLRKVQHTTGIGYQQIRTQIKNFTSTLMDRRVSISYVTYGSGELRSGMELYRLHYPYVHGIATHHSDEFKVNNVTYDYIAKTPELESDIYVCSRVRFPEIVDKIIAQGKKLVVDVDDYWKLHKEHPIREEAKAWKENQEYVAGLTYALEKAHMVTVTTETLAQACWDEMGVKAVVVKNTIPEDASQFHGEKFPHSKIRLGWIGGNHHYPDIFPMYDAMRKLHSSPDLHDKYQVCLGGFNINPHYFKYEKILTADYHCTRADQDYRDYLNANTPALDHIAYNASYRRMWAKPVTTYGEMYRQIDVALVPLMDTSSHTGKEVNFNACKSELKIIEAGMTRTAAIVSDVMPYSPHLKHEVNCLSVSPKRQDWFAQIRRMVMDQDLREETADNLHKYVKKNFNHRVETNKLATALKRLA